MKRGAVRIAGAEFGFIIEGSGASLLVAGSSIYYPRTFSDRLKRSRTLVCADLPHFADLQPGFRTEAIGYDLYADCIEAVRATTGFDRVAIAGHSHHGNVALEYAKRYAQHVSHVVLIGAPPVDVEQTLAAGRHYWDAQASTRRKALLEQRRKASTRSVWRCCPHTRPMSPAMARMRPATGTTRPTMPPGCGTT